jgi:hypothetical protein
MMGQQDAEVLSEYFMLGIKMMIERPLCHITFFANTVHRYIFKSMFFEQG